MRAIGVVVLSTVAGTLVHAAFTAEATPDAAGAAAQEDTTALADTLSLAEIRQRLGFAESRADNAEPHLTAAVEHLRIARRALDYWVERGVDVTADSVCACEDTVTIQPAALRSPISRIAPPDSAWLWDEPRAGRAEGAFEIQFWVDTIAGVQGLVSRDHTGFGAGGHLSVYVDADSLIYRLQSDSASRTLSAPIARDSLHTAIVGWGPDGMVLLLDEHLEGWLPDYRQGTAATVRMVATGALIWTSEPTTYDPVAPLSGGIRSLALWRSYRDVDRALPEGNRSGPWVGSNDTTTSGSE